MKRLTLRFSSDVIKTISKYEKKWGLGFRERRDAIARIVMEYDNIIGRWNDMEAGLKASKNECKRVHKAYQDTFKKKIDGGV